MTITRRRVKPYQQTPLDVQEGDIIIEFGSRCRATEVTLDDGAARYTLHSAPNDKWPKPLPVGFEGTRSGGNELAVIHIEARDRNHATSQIRGLFGVDQADADHLLDEGILQFEQCSEEGDEFTLDDVVQFTKGMIDRC